MPRTPADFKSQFRAFTLVDDAVVQAKLDEAYVRTGPSWGALQDQGAMTMAAHLLAIDPLGEPSARQAEQNDGSSTYLHEWERMLRQVRVFGTSTNMPAGEPVIVPPAPASAIALPQVIGAPTIGNARTFPRVG